MTETLPQIGDRYFKERAGVSAVAGIINDLQCIWRETSNADVGIDGQIEHVDEAGRCTGRILAAQIKSGPSFFQKSTATHIRFWPEEKHRNYWRDFPVPVMIILFDIQSKCAYWADARRQLRSPGRTDSSAIEIPWEQRLDVAHREQLFETAGPIDGELLPLEGLIKALALNALDDPGFNVSFLDLFAIGVTDIGRKLFFSMGTACEIASVRARLSGRVGFSVDSAAQDFCGKYIRFLVSQNIIRYDFTDFLIDWEDRQLQPTILCPLTTRGSSLLRVLQMIAGRFGSVFSESPVEISENCLATLHLDLEALQTIRQVILLKLDTSAKEDQ